MREHFYLVNIMLSLILFIFLKKLILLFSKSTLIARGKSQNCDTKESHLQFFFFFREEIKLRELQDGSQNSVKKSIVRKKLQ